MVLDTVITIINYDRRMFIVQATEASLLDKLSGLVNQLLIK
jgi:hypothetical protein